MSSESKIIIKTPVIDSSQLEELRIGDMFYLSGILVTARDAVHKRFLIDGESLPIDLKDLAILHAGPVMKKVGEKWQCISIGPTTSRRMEYYEDEFIEKTGVKIIIGKGGMGKKTADACSKHKAIYAIFPGGCGVLGASEVEEVIDVKWEDLGMPEALWILKVKEFGPLIVSIDTRGNNLSDAILEESIMNGRVTGEKLEKKLKEMGFL
ncbi:L(+)-tartrate dehydratase subunit beta [Fervidicoccus fontis]|uniref:L(+)-tartrate dehydratase subunit beta n=3 Tax=Fervidicoccus fontis TaxID=683846 RepID=I0A0M5_FERFK|nr:L(+)-tartrate dehydratase subunit beta [Fervidicoccus fontis]AFH42532.1 L(+)-tartrate dehydratase subunit beta [Fervidicoccus fontis Kam940]HEW64056.1 L(+)-tartrate dehydratase subunit beta [Fervidicoccus fontis]